MKTTIKTFVKKISFAFVLASSLALASCTIGLGEAVDMHGPSVTITAPEARENVKDKFRIAGTVQDDFDIWYVTVTIKDGDSVKGEWRNENNTWKYKENSNAEYTPYENATWNLSETGKAAEWAINDASISGQGTFTIVVSAVDKSGNASEESTKSRDVIIDGEPPMITISSLNLSADKETFNIADYKDITKISLFQTGDFTISGNAKDDNAIAWLELHIKDAENGAVYFEKKITLDDVDSLRSWEIPVTLKDCKLQDLDSQKHVLQIFTKTADAAGNTNDDLISQGYTCLWKEADKPWISLPELEGTTDALTYSIYSGSPLQGTAYDDTGISKVTVSVYEGDGFTKAVEGYENRVVYEGNEEKENTAQFELETPEDYKKYKVVIKAYDNNNKQADDFTGYIKVEDKTYPAIEITYSDGENEKMVGDKTGSDTLFGDKNGDFTLNIRALDDTQVTSIKMVHITSAEDVLDYANESNNKWNKASTITFTATGNIVTSLKGVSRKEYKAYKQMNIFTDLGIDGDAKKLGNQTFVFRVEDNNGNAITRTFTIQGDTESPTIKFAKMEYYQDGKNLTKTYTGGETLPAFGLESKVKVYGTISDNSAARWGYTKAFDLDKTLAEKRFKLSSGNQLDPTINTETGEFTAEVNNLKGASLTFDATLTDYNGNSDAKKFSFLVDTQTPTVDYISSDNENKCYKTGDQIDVYIRFNMQMKFTGSPSLTLNNGASATAKTAADTYTNQFVFTYTVGASDTETDDLNVKSVNLDGVTIYRKDTSGNEVKDVDITSDIKEQLTALTNKANLSEMKDIVILINAPKLVGEPVWNETAGTLTLTYDKAVSKGSGDVTITQQTKDNADGIDKVPPVILKSKYDTLVKTATNLGTYYEAGINGTGNTGTWSPDYTAKYILKWEYNADNSSAIDEYKKAGTYKLTCNVKSSKVTLSSDCKTVTVMFGTSPLPCKGANYKVVIPEGFMQHQKGGSDYPTAKKNVTITAAGMEAPVIRISTASKTTIAASGSGYAATQPFTSSFKIDCESDYDSLTYHWDLYKYNPTEVWTNSQSDAGGTQIENGSLGSGTRVPANGETSYNTVGTEVEIGIDKDYSGLTYRITATATKGSTSEKGYNKACRSGIEVTRFKCLHEGDVITNTSAGWKGGDNSAKIGLFIKGGDNPSGGNNVDGLPVTWSPTDYTKYLMFTETTSNDYTYYLLTWDITSEKLYFWLFAGIMDAGTVTDASGVSKGPNYVNAAQNNYTNKYKEYPLGQGEYIKITNTVNKGNDYCNVGFSVADAGKPTKVREPQN